MDKTLSKVYFLLLIGIAISLPYSLKFNNILIITALVVKFFLLYKEGNIRIIKTAKWPIILLILYYLTHLISLLWSDNIDVAFRHLEVKLPFIIFPFLLLTNRSLGSKKELRHVLLAFSLSVLVGCLFSHYNVIMGMIKVDADLIEWNRWWNTRSYLSGHIGMHPTYMTIYISFASIILLHYISSINNTIISSLLIVAVAYFVLFNFLLVSRANLIIHLLILIIFIFHSISKIVKTKVLRVMSLLMLMLILAFVGTKMPLVKKEFYSTYNYFQSEDLDNSESSSTSSHFKSWHCSILLQDALHLLTGFGAGDGKQNLLDCYLAKGYMQEYDARHNAHNEYFSSLLRIGIMGPIILIALFVFGFSNLRHEGFIMLNAFIVIMIFALVGESIFSTQKGVVFFTFFYCLLLNYHSQFQNEKDAVQAS